MNDTDGTIRLMAGLALAVLAGITAVVSYLHALSVVHRTGSTGAVAYLIPFVADLMIVTASLALLEAARNRARKPPLAVVSVAVGVGATLAMNVAAGMGNGPGAALINSLPPVALVLSLETLMGLIRRARGGQPEPLPGQCPHQVAGSAEEAVVTAFLHGRDCLEDQPSQRHLSATFGLSRAKVAELVGPVNGHHPPDPGDDPPDN